MYVSKRKEGQRLVFSIPPSSQVTEISVIVESVDVSGVKLAVDAPKKVRIDRDYQNVD